MLTHVNVVLDYAEPVHVCIVVDYAATVSAYAFTTRTHGFTNIFAKQKISPIVLASSYGAQVECFDLKSVENLVTLSL